MLSTNHLIIGEPKFDPHPFMMIGGFSTQHGFADDQRQLPAAARCKAALCQHGIHQETRNLGARGARCTLETL